MSASLSTSNSLPKTFLWLADAPLFIDSDQIGRFYDAVVRPANEEGSATYKVSQEQAEKVRNKLSIGGNFSFGKLLEAIGIPSIELKGEGEREKENSQSGMEGWEFTVHPIKTPQRQLVQLTTHYLLSYPERLLLIDELTVGNWATPEKIKEVPRALTFLNLPSLAEAQNDQIAETTLIPIAAEFTNGIVETFFDKIRPIDKRTLPPMYPAYKDAGYVSRRKDYWKWFSENFSIEDSVSLIEKAVERQGSRLQWIAYRIPIGTDGESLHLNVVANGRYDTGTFAYNFIRRGYEHGLRLVGSLKSGPDMNVLAVYDR